MDDTGRNVPESEATLREQQSRLLRGKRPVQMFPVGSMELEVPKGMERTSNERGIFHFNPSMISEAFVLELSAMGKENLMLELGQFDKSDVEDRVKNGETLTAITEYTKDGVEVRCAMGTDKTLPLQLVYFTNTQDPDNKVIPRNIPPRLMEVAHGCT